MFAKFAKSAVFAAVLLASPSVFAQPAVIVTGEQAGKSVVLGLDFVADKQPVTVVMVEIKLRAGAKAESLNLSNCMRGLAKTHTGGCNVKSNGNLAFIAYGAGANEPLASGPIGSVTVPADLLETDANGQVIFEFVEFTLPDSSTISGEAISDVAAAASK